MKLKVTLSGLTITAQGWDVDQYERRDDSKAEREIEDAFRASQLRTQGVGYQRVLELTPEAAHALADGLYADGADYSQHGRDWDTRRWGRAMMKNASDIREAIAEAVRLAEAVYV